MPLIVEIFLIASHQQTRIVDAATRPVCALLLRCDLRRFEPCCLPPYALACFATRRRRDEATGA
jgi:hypothetical protein